MESAPKMGFHESTIVRVRNEVDSVILDLDGVHFDDNVRTASIRMTGVHAITRDGISVEKLLAECEDGEVLTLQFSEKDLQLIVECTDFKNHHNQTHSYRITCKSIRVEAD